MSVARQTTMTPAETARLLQIITIAMTVGVVAFCGFVVFVFGALQKPAEGNLLSLVAVGVAVVAFVTHLILPELVVGQSLKATNGDVSSLCGLYLLKTIVASALLEGAAFFNLVALMIEHHWWSLVIVGGLVLWMASQIPNVVRIGHWVEAKQAEKNSDPGVRT